MKGDYYNIKESVDEYIKLAKHGNGKPLIEKLKLVLPTDSEVLEIGSGPGTDWNILGQTYHVTGSDSSNEFLNYLIANNPNGEFLELDAITLTVNRKFDGIYSNKVLHHLSDGELKNLIKRQSEILNSKGIVCHSFWQGEGSEIFKGLFVNCYSEVGLIAFFKDYFEILSVESYSEFENNDSLLFIGKKR